MLKKICSVVLVFVMLFSMTVVAFGEYSFIEGFKENNLPAKKVVVSDEYAFVVCGEGNTATDTINIYKLGTKELVTTLKFQVYKTGRYYYIDNMYIVGDSMYIVWNQNDGWGDCRVRKYEISKLLSGSLEEYTKSIGINGGSPVSCLYENKLFFTDGGYKSLSILDTTNDSRKVIMNMDSVASIADIKGVLADANYFYILRSNEIRAYSTEDAYAGLMTDYDTPVAVYVSENVIDKAVLSEGNIYLATNEGMDVLKINENAFEDVSTYTAGGGIMAMEPAGKNMYVYASGAKEIQILDVTNPSNITKKDAIKVNNQNTAGIKDIEVKENRIYAADLTDGFTLYSANKLDSLEQTEITAETYAQELEISKKAKAIELVVGLKLMALRDNGLFGSELFITRGEFADSVSKLLGEDVRTSHAINQFSDVAIGSQYADGIYTLANLGILNGYGDGTFRPDDPVSYEHAVMIMVKVLGYSPYVERGHKSYETLAGELKLLNNVSPMQNGYISRENVAQLIYNALETPTLKLSSGLIPYEYKEMQDETLLYKMDIVKVRGQVKATEFTSLTGTYTAARGKVRIDDAEYYEGTSYASSFLGRYVTAYCKNVDDEPGEIIYVVKNKNENIITVDAKDISEETTKTVFAYRDENDNIKKENISDASIIYNGKFYAEYKKEDLILEDGEVTLIDSDNDGGIDAIIVDSYKTYIVDAYGSGIFKFKYGYPSIDLNKLPKDAKINITVDGFKYDKVSDVVGIQEKTVVSVKSSVDNEIMEIHASNSYVSGAITKIVSYKTIDIEGVEYKLHTSYNKNAANIANNIKKVEVSDEVLAYTNKFGKIADFEYITASTVYGYLVGVKVNKGLDTSAQFKILAYDNNNLWGSMQYFDSAEKYYINGNKVEDIYSIPELYNPTTGFKKQIVKFVLGKDGKLKHLYTAKNMVDEKIDGADNPNYDSNYIGYTENEFTYDAYIKKSLAYRGGHMDSFEAEPFIPVSDTVVFLIPSGEDPKDEDYKIYKYTGIFQQEKTSPADVYCYDVTPDYNIGAIVLKASAANVDNVASSRNFALVDSFILSLNEDGEEKWIMRSGKDADGNEIEYVLADENLTDTLGDVHESYKNKRLLDLPKGSVVQYITNGVGEIAAVRILFTPQKEKVYYEYGSTASSASSISLKIFATFAKVIKYTNDGRLLLNGKGIQEDGTMLHTYIRNFQLGGCLKYLYDSSTNRLTTIEPTDILPGDDIFMVRALTNTKMIIVFR